MKPKKRFAILSWGLLGALLVAACSGNSPVSPSSTAQGIVLKGSVLGVAGSSSAGASAAGAKSSAATGPITITVQEDPAITAVVGADGSFTLRGLPPGGFTLVFTRDGAVLGTLTFAAVLPNQEITITVDVTSGVVVLLQEQRDGIGHGDLEIEGLVEQVLLLDPASDSRFLIRGTTVIARPGQTAIREGNQARTVTDVTVGRRVHVKGVWQQREGTVQPVLALEIKLQGDAGPSPSPSPSSCTAGAKAEVEGLITAKGASDITVNQQAKGDYLCEVSASTQIRKGNTSYTLAQLQLGWRVHVKGTMLGLAGSACRVSADEIKVQNN